MHDIYYGTALPPHRAPIQLLTPSDRIAAPYLRCPPEKIIAVVPTPDPDYSPPSRPADGGSQLIAGHVLDFLTHEVRHGRLPATLPPLQSGVGNITNAVLAGLDGGPFPPLTAYTEVIQDGMRRLVAAGLVPERAGQPVKVVAHISLADLLLLDGSSALQEEWTARLRARWAGHRGRGVGVGQRRRCVAGRRRRRGDCVRRGDGPDRHRGRQPRRPGGSGPAVRPAGPAPPPPPQRPRRHRAQAATAPARAAPAASVTTARTAPTALAPATPAAPARTRPARTCPPGTPRGPGKRSSRRSSAKPRFFYCTLDPRLTCGDVHDEGIASLRPARLNVLLVLLPSAPGSLCG